MICPKKIRSQEVIGKGNYKGYVIREGHDTMC